MYQAFKHCVSWIFVFSSKKTISLIATVLIFLCTICTVSNFRFSNFSVADADFFSPFSYLSKANETCVTFVSICHFGCHFPVLKEKSKDVKAKCVRMMVRGKEAEKREWAGCVERESWVEGHPSLPPSSSSCFSPAIHPNSFSETCWLTAEMQYRLFI